MNYATIKCTLYVHMTVNFKTLEAPKVHFKFVKGHVLAKHHVARGVTSHFRHPTINQSGCHLSFQLVADQQHRPGQPALLAGEAADGS
jgi:hypothetical protein